MPKRPIDWDAIQTVTEVARYPTVRAAAVALGVHHTTASRRIEHLEERLGVRLFDRGPDGFVLTEAGEAFVRLGRRFSDDLNDVRRRLEGRDAELSGTVTITMAEPLFTSIFADALPAFAEAYPALELNFAMSVETLDLARREADLAVRMDNNPPDALVGKRLFAYRETAYSTPDYLSATTPHRTPERARRLAWRPDEDAEVEWARAAGLGRIQSWGCFPTIEAQRAACSAGLGIALLPCLFGDADPRLVRATDRAPAESRMIWLLTHTDLRRTARIRTVMDWAERILRDARPRIIGDA
ncbi:MAG: LysR family transcriptional regulator [Pseudomonadota bacterium]